MKVAVIIPARYDSSRLPGKPLVDLCGRPMIQHVYERAMRSSLAESVVVATDDERVLNAVRSFGGQAVLTSTRHRTGTDRLAEVAESHPSEVLVNLQGDLPLLSPEMLDELITQFCAAWEAPEPVGEVPRPEMGTLMREIRKMEELYNPNVVKVVADEKGRALYFSRAPIPYVRDVKTPGRYFKHYGIYIYTRDFLKTFTRLPQGALEQMEKLEQLRALEHGFPIQVVETQHDCIEVDTPEDLERVRTDLVEASGKGPS